MCGISGFVIAPDDFGRINTRLMTMALGYEMKTRGTDATGIYTVDSKGRWKVRKQALPSDVFLAYRNGIGNSAKTLMLHTRAATQGKETIAENNHPIVVGGIVGIHNGIVWNDDQLFKHFEWNRIAQVDSEAIFAALDNLPQAAALEQIDGSWAIAWADTDDDPNKLWLCRGSGSPLHYATTKNGSVVFASTANAVKEAFDYGGIKGLPDVTMAPEGFLAYIDPDGGLKQQTSPDTSGKLAIGARASTTWKGHNYGAGMSWYGEDEEWRVHQDRMKTTSKDDPIPNVRHMVKGDAKNLKVDDVRKYIDEKGDWHFEKCNQVTPIQVWKQVWEWEPKEPVVDEAVVLPFEDEAADFMCAYAKVGDFVTFDKSLIDGGRGYFGGYVTAVNDDGTITVDFRATRLDKNAAYLIASWIGKEKNESSTQVRI